MQKAHLASPTFCSSANHTISCPGHPGRIAGSHSYLRPRLPPSVLVSWGCCNKWPQTRRLGATETEPLAVLEAGSRRSRCWRGWLFLEALGRLCPVPVSLSPVALIGPLSTCLGLQTHRGNLGPDPHVAVFLSLRLCFLMRATVIVKRPLRSSMTPASFNKLLLQRLHLQIRSHSELPGDTNFFFSAGGRNSSSKFPLRQVMTSSCHVYLLSISPMDSLLTANLLCHTLIDIPPTTSRCPRNDAQTAWQCFRGPLGSNAVHLSQLICVGYTAASIRI